MNYDSSYIINAIGKIRIVLIEMMTLTGSTSDIFNNIFTLESIEEVYKKDVAWRYLRGVDRVTPYQFEQQKDFHFEIIHRKCLNGTYKFAPFSERLRLRGRDRKPRVISIATMRDRIVLSLLKNYLHTVFAGCVNRKLPNTYIREIKEFYKTTPNGNLFSYKVDIQSFYDCINHHRLQEILMGRVASKPEIVLIKRAIQTPTVAEYYSRAIPKNTLGIPQGLAVSNILANIYFEEPHRKFEDSSLFYRRYVDDLLFICKEDDVPSMVSLVNDELTRMGLSCSEDKTILVPINYEFDYLGYRLNLPTVSIKTPTVERFLRSMSALFSAYASRGAGIYKNATRELAHDLFISDVNERITGAISENRRYGWLFYFQEMNDLSLLYKMDAIIKDKFCKRITNIHGLKPLPEAIKTLAKAYYATKYHPLNGYVHNYDNYDTIPKKLEYLKNRGIIPPGEETTFSPEDIERLFNINRRRRLADLDSDIGEAS